ncbi:MAPEG family protein [uncultured Litoreibacter sp.]|uniref:MAPEG family protein n=1 Tax=uncultured Litoreibacter sp. TaxID=1392394 RepID=UPI00261153B8|nr:MAPEG family protein [uncultured Litoreibacter sp.]
MPFIELVAVLAVLQYLYFGYLVGGQRRDSGLKGPAVSGHDGFERAYRVQMNTLECLIAFLPMLFIAGTYWSALLVAPIGVVYLVGRMLFWRAYMTDPSSRGLGFMLSFYPIAALLLMAAAGAVMGLFA